LARRLEQLQVLTRPWFVLALFVAERSARALAILALGIGADGGGLQPLAQVAATDPHPAPIAIAEGA
jgi:hypothetical protein